MMRLNKTTTKTFHKIIEQIPESGKIDNTNGAFMPLVVEKLRTFDIGTEYSLCHYFKQNGDLCQDPEMVFMAHKSGAVYPMMFQMAIPPVHERSMEKKYDKWVYSKRLNREHTKFANMWLRNIKNQQKL